MFIIGRREDPLKETCDAIREAVARQPTAPATCATSRSRSRRRQSGRRARPHRHGHKQRAGNFMARTEKLSPNAFDTVVSIVLNGSFHCTQAFARKWIDKKNPAIS